MSLAPRVRMKDWARFREVRTKPESERKKRINGCVRKTLYDTQEAAESGLAWQKTQPDVTGELEVYKCLYCPGWHVGHQRDQRNQRDAGHKPRKENNP